MTAVIQPSTTLADLVTAQALYCALAELESDLRLHVHIENNRLFPMVVELEASGPR